MDTKGVQNLYEYCCDKEFYEWVSQERPGASSLSIDKSHICMGPVFYKDDEFLTLVEANYDPIHEESSTWKLTQFKIGDRGARLPHRPYKILQLETDDDLLVLKCKIRPVLLIKKIESDWRYPYTYFLDTWLCLPLFSYKKRHSQKYIISDQKLQVPHRFYFPPGNPGLAEECAGLINQLQCIPQDNLFPFKGFCDTEEPNMERPIKLVDKAFQAVIGHIAQFLPGINLTGDSYDWYYFFKELVNEQIGKVVPN